MMDTGTIPDRLVVWLSRKNASKESSSAYPPLGEWNWMVTGWVRPEVQFMNNSLHRTAS